MAVEPQQLLDALRFLHEASETMIDCADCELATVDDGTSEELLLSYMSAIIEDGTIELYVPGEDNNPKWEVDAFLSVVDECKTLSSTMSGELRTTNFAYQLIYPQNDLAQKVGYHHLELGVTTSDNVHLRLTNDSLAVGLHAIKVGAYDSDYYPAITAHQVVELDFSDCELERTENFDRELVDAYLFELAASHNIVFSKSTFEEVETSDPWDYEEEDLTFRLRPLEKRNEGVSLFMAACQVDDPELRFFSFYKVLEFFAPVILNLEAHESLRKKLDSPAALAPDGTFIRELLQLSKSFDQRKKEEDLIKGVLLSAIDIVGLNNLIPEAHRRNVTYDSSKKDLDNYAKQLAVTICTTRHQVAHAKANYEVRGTESNREDLPQFNEFLSAAAAEAVRWYNRLPEHQRAELND